MARGRQFRELDTVPSRLGDLCVIARHLNRQSFVCAAVNDELPHTERKQRNWRGSRISNGLLVGRSFEQFSDRAVPHTQGMSACKIDDGG
jgi:hypothetical protein